MQPVKHSYSLSLHLISLAEKERKTKQKLTYL